ncbi:response regulator [Sphingomonas sp. BIUV-7]|uniref:Response regulator n=1 Tax=Sphingomonas natans TaxID=3063330 RepID=A0ABT8Y7G5_9SPHN|nr:response regulator [Sphingomonas sp. BIUV-7]MDO6414265.1 response regulator [Sphingomonas sp. BIUV-7]
MITPLAGKRILVVEDEMAIMIMLVGALEELGCEAVFTASTVIQACDILAANLFDAAMLDINLSGTTSYPVAAVLQGRGIPFIFSTGYQVERIPERYKKHIILTKPYPMGELARAFTALLGPAPR